MPSRLLFLGFLLLAPLALSAATPAPKATPSLTAQPANSLAGVAPADEYFGAFGMSPLSIRSTIGALGRQYHYRTISDRDLLRKALITEAALRIWRARYPADPWLPPTFYHLEQLYQAVQTAEARKHATAMLKDVIHNYPSTKEGHLSRARLAAGFPPLVPETPLITTPPPSTPSAGPENGPSGPPSPTGSTEPQANPRATPGRGGGVPSPSPSSSPS